MIKESCILQCLCVAAVVFLLNQAQFARAAITLGQVDDFQAAVSQDWRGAAPSYPLDSGPSGIGDTSLQITATGAPASGNGKLLARHNDSSFNISRWDGDYTSAGVTSIMVDVNNFHTSSITLRTAVLGAGGTYSSNTGIVVPALSGWQNISLPLDDLVPVSGAVCCGSGDPNNNDPNGTLTFSTVNELRILHNTSPGWQGIAIAGNFRLDNVTAAARCDLDGNLLCGLSDINLMFSQGNLVTGLAVTSGSKFDLDNDNDIDNGDIDAWLEKAATHNGYSSAFRRGDTDDLDTIDPPGGRTVDITDFQNFLDGFTGSAVTWEVGNFDGDGDVDITDFSNHFLPGFIFTGGGSYGAAQAIPEPSAALLLGLGTLLGYLGCRRQGTAQ